MKLEMPMSQDIGIFSLSSALFAAKYPSLSFLFVKC